MDGPICDDAGGQAGEVETEKQKQQANKSSTVAQQAQPMSLTAVARWRSE
jgi:hypothetical protein